MTDQATTSAVSHSVTVPLSREQAFRLFVDEHGSWWPRDSGAPMREAVGGDKGWPELMALYERAASG
ncbi:MAG: hypothetical protein ACRDL4_11315 [Thermoleophilaceae bacterium]